MKKYEIYVRWEGVSHSQTLEGTLHIGDGYYQIRDANDKVHLFPINITMIEEV